VEQFLYQDARLLDERYFHAWLDLLTDDVRYWKPVRSNRYPKASKAIAILDPDRYAEAELAKDDELAILDEAKETLARRIARLETGMAWTEDSRLTLTTLSPVLIPLANSGSRGGVLRQGDEWREPGLDRSIACQPSAEADKVDRRGREDVLEMRFGHTIAVPS
jgi:Ring hydroxylating beta subunit